MATRYITWTDVTNRYPNATTKAAEPKMEGSYIEYAEAEVDGRLAPMYSTPFVPGSSSVPYQVRDLSIDLAYYKMNWQQPWAAELRKMIDDRFDRILKGDEVLTSIAGTLLPDAPGEAWSSQSDYHTAFGPDDVTNYTPSSAWMDAVQSEREYG